MGDGSKAVFLSYASQDGDAARRICDALRAAGVEIWFDQSELRGGDAWDQRIRRQIKECALFVPIISTNTQAREEGYFRLEWRLADQRTHLMARNKTFLVPVCVDGTADTAADVPESFLSVQWTRLPGGEASSEFCRRIAVLLGGGENSSRSQRDADTAPPFEPPAKWTRWLWVGTAGGLLVGAIALQPWRLIAPKPTPAPAVQTSPNAREARSPQSVDAQAGIDERSIAVLAFVDMSEKKDQEYFSDGLAEELLNLLAKTPGLQVTARTSSFSFKGKSDDIPTIARKLNVANILEGSVRKSGRHLRISTQLIRADTGVHIWSETYDRDVRDVFKVQDDIAAPSRRY